MRPAISSDGLIFRSAPFAAGHSARVPRRADRNSRRLRGVPSWPARPAIGPDRSELLADRDLLRRIAAALAQRAAQVEADPPAIVEDIIGTQLDCIIVARPAIAANGIVE